MPKQQKPDDNASEASYYSYSEYTIPASEISVNRRWYNRLDNWRQDVSPSTPKNEHHQSSPRSHLNLPRAGQDEVESTVSPKESISSRPSPKIMPRILEPPMTMPLLREEPRIMNDGRMDMVRVYDAGNGIEARLHPPVMDNRRAGEVPDNRLGLDTGAFDQDVTKIRLPSSQGTFYTDSQARKLHPIQDPYRLPLPTSRGTTVYTRGPQLDRDLPPLPPSQSTQLPPRPPRKPLVNTPLSESFYSDSQPLNSDKRYRTEGRAGDSALARLDTILERTDKENARGQTYRKGTPYPSVRNLNPSEASTEFTTQGYKGRGNAREDSESTVERVIERTTRTKTARAVPNIIPTVDDIPEHAPRKRYPDPVPVRQVPKRASTIVVEQRRPVTSQVVHDPEPKPVLTRPSSRAEQAEDRQRLSKQRSTKVESNSGLAKVIDLPHPAPAKSIKEETSQRGSRPASVKVTESLVIERNERESDPATRQASVKSSTALTPASETRSSAQVSSPVDRGRRPRSQTQPDAVKLSRKALEEGRSPLSFATEALENALKGSSHGSVWTDTLLSTPDSRHRRDHSPENLRDENEDHERYSGPDSRSRRDYRPRSPSPPRRRISLQSPAGYMGLNQMVPQQPFPAQGAPNQLIHPPMMPGGAYRAMLQPPPPPGPPVMPLMARSLPPPIMSPPQATFPWMGSMSPPMANWMPQRPTSGIHAGLAPSTGMNPSMVMRNSLSVPGVGHRTTVDAGTRRRGRIIEDTRGPRDRSTRSGQQVPLSGRLPTSRLEGVPQSRRVRRSNPAIIAPRRTDIRSRPILPVMASSRRSGVPLATGRRRSSGGNGMRKDRGPSRSRNSQNAAQRPTTGGNPATTNWVRNILTLNRRPGRGSS